MGNRKWVRAMLGWAIALCGAGAASAEPAAYFVAVSGESAEGSLAEGETFETGPQGRCALLADGDLAIQVCGDTAFRLHRNERGQRIVHLDRGHMRMSVEPRSEAERVEIHTPAAIATLLGTIAHVEVDPETRETSITSEESRIRIRSATPGVPGQTTVGPAEQVTLRPGEPPPAAPTRLGPEHLPDLPGCRVDFREIALDKHREERIVRAMDHMTLRDGGRAARALGEFMPIPANGSFEPGAPGDDPTDPGEVCTGTDCAPMQPAPPRQQLQRGP